jgi:hypothetical protein
VAIPKYWATQRRESGWPWLRTGAALRYMGKRRRARKRVSETDTPNVRGSTEHKYQLRTPAETPVDFLVQHFTLFGLPMVASVSASRPAAAVAEAFSHDQDPQRTSLDTRDVTDGFPSRLVQMTSNQRFCGLGSGGRVAAVAMNQDKGDGPLRQQPDRPREFFRFSDAG